MLNLKKFAIALLCTLPLLTSCSREPVSQTRLETAAKARNFEMTKDGDTYTFTKNGCVVKFYYFENESLALTKYIESSDPIMESRSGGSQTKAYMFSMHFSSSSSEGKFFLAAQIGPTLLFSDNPEKCEKTVSNFADAIQYTL